MWATAEQTAMATTDYRSWAHQIVAGRDPLDAWPPPIRLRAGWRAATLLEVTPEAPDAATLRLRRSDGESFLPGQHFHLEVPTGGVYPAVETYSVASSPWPDPRIIDLTVKEVPGGRVSPVLVRRVPVGAVLALEGPFGYFTWNEADGGPLALVGAGSGIVPLMAMIRYAAAKGLRVPMRLVYSSKDVAHAVYLQELARLAELHPWLGVVHTFTEDPVDPAARYHRRIDREMLTGVLGDIADACVAYVCGPFDMVRTAEDALGAIGIGPGRLRSENWE